MNSKKKFRNKFNKIKKIFNSKNRSEKEEKKYKETMITINKHFHKGEYDEVDKILNKLNNNLNKKNIPKKHVDNKLSVKGSRQTTQITVETYSGSWGAEVSWDIVDPSGATILSGSDYSSNQTFTDSISLGDGCYNLNMYDSFGDGWNGAYVDIISDSETVRLGTAFTSGASYTESFCIPIISGCTDPLSSNYDPLANTDDGSCVYPCLESDSTITFENGLLFPFVNDSTNTTNWIINSGTTISGSTGPPGAFDGLYYVYTETSGAGSDADARMSISCVDLSAWDNPALTFRYHMYGETMGTLNVNISTDGGSTWANAWTMSGDQGNQWNLGLVSLSSYGDTQIAVEFHMATGSFTSDAALDMIMFSENIGGCTDPFADNYDPLAIFDEGSCLYTGCLDQYAPNYCASCNVQDISLCTYYPCRTLNYMENFEYEDLITMGYTTINGPSVDGLSFASSEDALTDSGCLQFTGGDTFFATQTSDTAFNNSTHLASVSFCIDLSGSGSDVDLRFNAGIKSIFPDCAWFRVLVNNVVQNEKKSGINHFSDQNRLEGFTSTNINQNIYGEYLYDLDAWAGQSNVYITFQTMINYSEDYGSPGYVFIDNVEVYEVTPCTYYNLTELFSFNPLCNGGATGNAMVLANNSYSTSGDQYTWLTSAGSIYATTQQVTNLVADTYTVVATDPDNCCNAAIQVVITDPPPIEVDSTGTFVVNTPTVNDSLGLINITPTGGTCTSDIVLATPIDANNGQLGNMFNIINTYNIDITIVGMNQGPTYEQAINPDEPPVTQNVEWWYSVGNYTESPTNWVSIVTGSVNITAGDPTGIIMFPNPVVIPANTTYAFHCIYDVGIGYTNGVGVPGTSIRAEDNYIKITEGHGCSAFGDLSFAQRNWNGIVIYSDPDFIITEYLWSNGAITQNISGLGVGEYTVSITDCNQCTGTETFSVSASQDPGCTDNLADNYNPLANTDDDSCLYYGCTDSNAINYDIGSNYDDGSCEYTCVYQGYAGQLMIKMYDSFGDGWNGAELNIQDINGDSIVTSLTFANGFQGVDSLCINNGCYHVTVTNGSYPSEISWDLVLDGDTLLSGGAGFSGLLQIGEGTCNLGCTDSTANNYDSNAVTDNGSCIYSCTDNVFTLNLINANNDIGGWGGSELSIYDGSGNLITQNTLPDNPFEAWDSLCLPDGCYIFDVSSGTNDANVIWNLIDGAGNITVAGGAPYADTLCFPAVGGCTDVGACNYDAFATLDNGTCDYSCVGCTDSTAFNYDPLLTIDDGSCLYCNLSGSSFVVDASANGAANGSIDFTPVGSLCNIDISDSLVLVNGDQYVHTSTSTGNTFFMNFENTNSFSMYVYGFRSFYDLAVDCCGGVYAEGNSMWSRPGTAQGYETSSVGWTFHGETFHTLSVDGQVYHENDTPIHLPPNTTTGIALHHQNENNFSGSSLSVYTPNYANISGVKISTAMTEYNAIGTFTGTPLGGEGTSWNPSDTLFIGPGIESYLWSNGATTQDISGLNPGTYTVEFTDCNECVGNDTVTILANPVPGCTDPNSVNYNIAANVDDGSCIIPVLGCTDPNAFNYNPSANTDDSSCVPIVDGCTDVFAINFDPLANTDDSSCLYYGCMDPTANNYDDAATMDPNNVCCYDNSLHIQMYDSYGDTWNGSVMTITDVDGDSVFSGGVNPDVWGSGTGTYNQAFICLSDGCYYVTVSNNSWPSEVSWSISQNNSIINNGGVGNFELVVGSNTNVCVVGCTDNSALNYNPNASISESSCIYACTDNQIYSTMVTDVNSNECSFQISNHLEEVVYASPAVANQGSITALDSICLPDGCYTLTLLDTNDNGWVNGNLGSVTLKDASNAVLAYGQIFYGSSVSYSFTVGNCIPLIYGCTDSTATNFDPLANTDDNSCEPAACVADLTNNGEVGINDLLLLLKLYGLSC